MESYILRLNGNLFNNKYTVKKQMVLKITNNFYKRVKYHKKNFYKKYFVSKICRECVFSQVNILNL